MFFVFVYRTLGLSPGILGLALTLGSIGNVAWAAVAPQLSRLLGTFGAPVLFIAAAIAVPNFANPLWNVTAATIAPSARPAELQGRVTAAVRAIGMGVMRVGGLVGGAIATVASPATARRRRLVGPADPLAPNARAPVA